MKKQRIFENTENVPASEKPDTIRSNIKKKFIDGAMKDLHYTREDAEKFWSALDKAITVDVYKIY